MVFRFLNFAFVNEAKSPVRGFCGGKKMEERKVFEAVMQFRTDLRIETVTELERTGLEEACTENNIDYYELNEAEKEKLWKEMIAVVEEIEFNKEFSELYEED